MTVLYNRARMSTATTGTGTITLGSAVSGYATFSEAGVQDADSVSYVIEDNADFEIGRGTYTSSGTTLSRDTVLLSKISGSAGTSKINLSGSATVFISGLAEDFVRQPSFGVNADADSTNRLSANTAAVLFNRETDDIQVKLNKEAAGDTASLIFQTNFSGFGEFGLTGDNDFHIKVSPDNFSTTYEGLIVDKDNGQVDFPNGFSDASGTRTDLGLVIGTDVFTQRTITGTSGEIDVSNGNGVSGNPTLSLDSDQTTKTLTFIIDGSGSAITTGVKGYIEIPFACTITQATALADQSGSIVVDVWKDTYANYPPTDADSITASAPITISTATKSQDSTLTGWTTAITAGDILGFNVDSASTVTLVTVSLEVTIP